VRLAAAFFPPHCIVFILLCFFASLLFLLLVLCLVFFYFISFFMQLGGRGCGMVLQEWVADNGSFVSGSNIPESNSPDTANGSRTILSSYKEERYTTVTMNNVGSSVHYASRVSHLTDHCVYFVCASQLRAQKTSPKKTRLRTRSNLPESLMTRTRPTPSTIKHEGRLENEQG